MQIGVYIRKYFFKLVILKQKFSRRIISKTDWFNMHIGLFSSVRRRTAKKMPELFFFVTRKRCYFFRAEDKSAAARKSYDARDTISDSSERKLSIKKNIAFKCIFPQKSVRKKL